MVLKYLEWNLHAMGGQGYKIPDFVAACVKEKEVDFFVLVEFCVSDGFDNFRRILSDFDLYYSPYASGYNQVCIGIRKQLPYRLLSVLTENICDANIPEFLQVDVELGGEALSLMGTRIKTQSHTKAAQFAFLNYHLSTLPRYICLGDFNALSEFIKNHLPAASENIYGPRTTNGYYSHVITEKTKKGDSVAVEVALDWLIAKNVKSIYNGYDDASRSPYATFDWTFVTPNNGYHEKTAHDYLGMRGLPDHAILMGRIEI